MRDLLGKFELLKELSEEGRERLGEFLEEQRLDAGRTLFQTHDEAEEMFLVAEGQVRLDFGGVPIGLLGSGDVLGAASVVVIGKRECCAVAETPVRLLTLSRESYLRLRLDLPQVALAVQEGVLRDLANVVRTWLPELGRGAP